MDMNGTDAGDAGAGAVACEKVSVGTKQNAAMKMAALRRVMNDFMTLFCIKCEVASA